MRLYRITTVTRSPKVLPECIMPHPLRTEGVAISSIRPGDLTVVPCSNPNGAVDYDSYIAAGGICEIDRVKSIERIR